MKGAKMARNLGGSGRRPGDTSLEEPPAPRCAACDTGEVDLALLATELFLCSTCLRRGLVTIEVAEARRERSENRHA